MCLRRLYAVAHRHNSWTFGLTQNNNFDSRPRLAFWCGFLYVAMQVVARNRSGVYLVVPLRGPERNDKRGSITVSVRSKYVAGFLCPQPHKYFAEEATVPPLCTLCPLQP